MIGIPRAMAAAISSRTKSAGLSRRRPCSSEAETQSSPMEPTPDSAGIHGRDDRLCEVFARPDRVDIHEHLAVAESMGQAIEQHVLRCLPACSSGKSLRTKPLFRVVKLGFVSRERRLESRVAAAFYGAEGSHWVSRIHSLSQAKLAKPKR